MKNEMEWGKIMTKGGTADAWRLTDVFVLTRERERLGEELEFNFGLFGMRSKQHTGLYKVWPKEVKYKALNLPLMIGCRNELFKAYFNAFRSLIQARTLMKKQIQYQDFFIALQSALLLD